MPRVHYPYGAATLLTVQPLASGLSSFSVVQVYYIRNGGEPLLLACEDTKPCYQRLEELMAPILARQANSEASSRRGYNSSQRATSVCDRMSQGLGC